MIEVKKIYHHETGELLFDIDKPADPIVDPVEPPPDLPDGTISFAFAEIPEQIFVSGYADSEEMNIFHLSTTNKHPTGWQPSDGASGYTPNLKCDIQGSLPSGVTWDRNTGKFVYDGALVGAVNQIETVNFIQHDTGAVSDFFEIKLLEPTIEWSYIDSGEFNTAVLSAISSNTRDENVVLVKSGEYQGAQLRTSPAGIIDGYMTCFKDHDNFYLIQEPGVNPVLSGYKDDWDIEYDLIKANYIKRLLILADGTKHLHIKGIDLRFAEITSNGCQYGVINNSKLYAHPGGVDGWGFSYLKEEDIENSYFFIINFETYHYGNNEIKHPIYGHAVDEFTDNITGRVGNVHLNNFKAWETRSPGDTWGGHMFKSLAEYATVRNSWFSLCENPAIPDFTKNSWKPPVSLHSSQKVVMYNNDFYTFKDDVLGDVGQGGPNYVVLFQPRNMPSARGSMKPFYFSSPAMGTSTTSDRLKSGYGCWENWDGDDDYSGEWQSTKNTDFHGDNANYNYSETGTKLDFIANTTRAPVPAPFWDTVGNVSDPANTIALHKFLAHNRFHTITTANPGPNKKAITSRTTAPTSFQSSGLGNRDWLPVPPNWKERTYLFVINNTFDGFNTSSLMKNYETDFEEPRSSYDYPYSIKVTADVTRNNINKVGGDIIDGVGSNIAIPSWFKI